MIRYAFSLVVVSAALIVTANLPPAVSAEEVLVAPPRPVVTESVQPQVSAPAYVVFDMETGELLLSARAEEERSIASLTKLFLAAQVLTELEHEQLIEVTESDVATYGRAGKLQTGQQLSVRELLFPLLLESSNDAAAALARQLNEISYAHLRFADGSGLSAQNRASAAELARVVRGMYRVEPYIFDITSMKQYLGPYTGWINNSPVMDLEGYVGGKHGYTEAAGRTLVAIFAEEALQGRELGYVILGSDDVRADTIELRTVVARSVALQ